MGRRRQVLGSCGRVLTFEASGRTTSVFLLGGI